jgi:hypothetical protein
MASEDSDQALPGCPSIHRLGYFRDFDQAISLLMQTVIDHADTTSKLFKVRLLSRSQRIALKKRYDRLQEILSAIDNELGQMLTMIVVPPHDIDTTRTKEASKLLQCRPATDTLRHGKPM